MQNEQQAKKGFMEKFEAFFDKNYALIFAPIFVLVLYMSALYTNGVYPFGEKYTGASYDLSAQICPFIEHLFDVMQGKSTLTYSYAIVGGADVTGTFLYFFISPFSFLFLIFGDGRVAHASSIVMTAKLMALAFTGAWFAKKNFKAIPDYLCIAVGVVYAYCGYTFVASTYINWVDFLIYLPFCAWAFKRFVDTGKFFAFSALVACCIYTCFSIACFSLFTVFPALIVYALLCVGKERRTKFIAYLCLSFVVAILLALPVLLPALSAFLNSARGGSIFENLWYGFDKETDAGIPENFDSSQFVEDYTRSLYRKWSYIICDSIFVVLTLFWFVRRGLKDAFAKFMLVAGIMTLLPLVVDEAMLLMNMGSYMSYALRFGFLNALYFLSGACLAIDGWCYEKNRTFDGEVLIKEKEEKKHNYTVWVGTGILIAVTAVFAGLLLIYAAGDGYKKVLGWFIKDGELLKQLNGFSSRFAHSLGGAEGLLLPFIAVAVVAVVGLFIVSMKKASPRTLAIALAIVVGLQVVFLNTHLVVGNRSTQHIKFGSYATLSAELNERDNSYFRVKDYGKVTEDDNGSETRSDAWTACIPFTGNSNSFSVFSSVIDEDNFACFQLFGYLGNGKNSFKSTHNLGKTYRAEAFGDSFMGYKYFFVPKSQREDAEKKGYLKKVMADDGETHLSCGQGSDTYYVYENTIVFPSAYRVNYGEFRFPAENISGNRRENQEGFYAFLRGKTLQEMGGTSKVTDELATELSEYLWSKSAEEVEVGAGQIRVKITAKAGESLFMNFVASKGYKVTVNGKKAELIDNDMKFLAVDLEEGENEVIFTYSSPYIKYMAVGTLVGLTGLCAVALVLKKTKIIDSLAPVIAWAGIGLAGAVCAFFMLYPSCVFVVKLFALLL
ncbi:MAG: YfhO family protein [Clostridia bacterium]|nr:YfhO family protein [Clostridia bacterium]